MKLLKAWIGLLVLLLILGGFLEEVNAEKLPGVTYGNTTHQLIIVNKRNNTLAFFDDGVKIKDFRVATGRSAGLTPEGDYRVTVKWECPLYYKTKKGACEPGNPLGPRWLGLNVPGTEGYTYGIHGNNASWSIGTHASDGCVRMHNAEITWLFDRVRNGARVLIVNTSKTTEQLLRESGYEMRSAVPYAEDLTLLEEEKLYRNFHDSTEAKGKVSAGIVKTSAKAGEWYQIGVGKERYWIHPEQYYVGSVEPVDRYLLTTNVYTLYDEPSGHSNPIGNTESDTLKMTRQLSDWYFAEDEAGNTGWIRLGSHKPYNRDVYRHERTEKKRTERIEKILAVDFLAKPHYDSLEKQMKKDWYIQ